MEREGAGTSISQAPCWPPRSVTLLFTEYAVPREAALSSAGPGRRSHGERVLGECLPLKTAVGSPETHAHRAPITRRGRRGADAGVCWGHRGGRRFPCSLSLAARQLRVSLFPLLRREAALTTWPQAVSCGAQTPKQPRLDPPAAEPPTAFHRGGGVQMPPSEQPAQLPTDDFLMLPVTWIFIM